VSEEVGSFVHFGASTILFAHAEEEFAQVILANIGAQEAFNAAAQADALHTT